MARSRSTSGNARSQPPQPDDAAPSFVPPRKRPWLLALTILLLVGWLAFMAVLVARR